MIKVWLAATTAASRRAGIRPLLGGILATVSLAGTSSLASDADLVPEAWRGERAVVLEQLSTWRMVGKDRATARESLRILIQDERGLDYADQSFIYDATNTKIEKFEARAILPDGTVIDVPEDLIIDSLLYSSEDVEWRIRQFTFPGVEPGSTVEWSYSRTEQPFYTIFDWSPQRNIPVLNASFVGTIEDPHSDYMFFKTAAYATRERCDLATTSDMKAKTESQSIDCRHLPALADEPWSPPIRDRATRYQITTNPTLAIQAYHSWKSRLASYRERIEEFNRSNKKSRNRARDLAYTKPTVAEKVNAIHGFLMNEITVDSSRSLDVGEPR